MKPCRILIVLVVAVLVMADSSVDGQVLRRSASADSGVPSVNLPVVESPQGFVLKKKAPKLQPPKPDRNTRAPAKTIHRPRYAPRHDRGRFSPIPKSPATEATTAIFKATDRELKSNKNAKPTVFVQDAVILGAEPMVDHHTCDSCLQSPCACNAAPWTDSVVPQAMGVEVLVPAGKQLRFRDEYLCDGGDRKKPVTVDERFNINGADTEDTFGHYDTLDGKRIVSPSNRVCVYAPRFAAVRKIEGVFNARLNQRVTAFHDEQVLNVSRGKDFSSSTKQHVNTNQFGGSNRASGLETKTRGITSDQAVTLIGVRNSFSPYENLDLVKLGRHSSGETARLQLGMQSANVWQDNLGLKVNVKGAQPVIVNDLSSAQQLVVIDSDFDTTLRVTKLASRIAAESGEEIEFTIRFDNLSSKPVGNVTIVDNLTGRLQYVPGSAECSLKASFIEKPNAKGSLVLKWDIEAPVKPHKGGIIRFKCVVK